MFRPGLENFEWYKKEVEFVASCFDLHITILDSHCPETPHEIWIHREPKIGDWLKYSVNSEEWHKLRAEACGIKDIDLKYHLRSGYGKKCD